MTSTATIKITDTGWSLPGDLGELDDLELQAGILEGADAHDGISTASLALLHEDGAPRANVPARPWMRPTFDAHLDDYVDAIDQAVGDVAMGKADSSALVDVADKIAADLRGTIERGETGGPPLAASTLERSRHRKLGATPLVDTGALLEAIQGQVVDASRGGSGDG